MDVKLAILEDSGRSAGTIAIDASTFPRELAMVGGDQSVPVQGFVIVERDPDMRQALSEALPQLVRRVRERLDGRRIQALEDLIEALLVDRLLPEGHGGSAERAVVAAAAERREAFLRDWPCLSAEDVHARAGLRARNASATASRWKAAQAIFGLRIGGRELYPAFQFGGGRPLPAMARVLAALGPQIDGWQVALWMTAGNGWLPGDARPVDLLSSDPDAVEHAAHMAVAEPTW